MALQCKSQGRGPNTITNAALHQVHAHERAHLLQLLLGLPQPRPCLGQRLLCIPLLLPRLTLRSQILLEGCCPGLRCPHPLLQLLASFLRGLQPLLQLPLRFLGCLQLALGCNRTLLQRRTRLLGCPQLPLQGQLLGNFLRCRRRRPQLRELRVGHPQLKAQLLQCRRVLLLSFRPRARCSGCGSGPERAELVLRCPELRLELLQQGGLVVELLLVCGLQGGFRLQLCLELLPD